MELYCSSIYSVSIFNQPTTYYWAYLEADPAHVYIYVVIKNISELLHIPSHALHKYATLFDGHFQQVPADLVWG